MIDHNYLRSDYDAYVYDKGLIDGSFIYLLVYVDDMLIASKNMFKINRLKSQMNGAFEMNDLGAAKKILGMEIHIDQKASRLCISQKNYIERVKWFGMIGSKPMTTPLLAHFRLSTQMSPEIEGDRQQMTHIPYSSVVGSMMYAMVCTFLDISNVVIVMSRFIYIYCLGKVIGWK